MDIRLISVVVPMLNEAGHVGGMVGDLAQQSWDGELELLVADGRSTDGSVDELREAAERHDVALTVLDNPARWVSHGLNACISSARGELIVRLDCHSRYPRDYLELLARAAQETGAWNVGGIIVPQGRTATERAVACAMDSPFGGIGWTRAGAGGERVEVDTVTFGAFRPAAFAAAGLYDETLVRNQDDELNLRIRRAGGRIVLDPAISVGYTPRGSLRKVLRQYFEYGLWKVPVMRRHGQVLGVRSLAPVALVGSLAALGVAAIWLAPARMLLGAEVGLYITLGVVAAIAGVRARGEPLTLAPRVLAAFPAFHVGYGSGMALGLLRALRGRPAD